MIDSQGREWHVYEREDGSITVYYTRGQEPVHYVVWDSLDSRPATGAGDLLSAPACCASFVATGIHHQKCLAQPASA